MTRCKARSGESLLLEFVVNLPEAQGALGGFLGQLAVVPPGDLEGSSSIFGLDGRCCRIDSTASQFHPADLQGIRTRSDRGPSSRRAIMSVGTLLSRASA